MRRLLAGLVGLLIALALGVSSNAPIVAQAAGASGGVVLDGYGGLHPFGGASINTSGAPYWPGWNIARAVAVKPDGSGGWMLDGFGGVHAFGNAVAPLAYPYWPNWDIARAIAYAPNGMGYEMDGFGGVHPLPGSPTLSGFPYWPGWDVARGLDIHTDVAGIPDGGWVLDGFGGIHAFGAAPAMGNSHYFPNFDVSRRLHVVPGGAYVVARFGIVETAGSPAGISWSGYPSWGAWDIVNDVAPLNPGGGTTTPTPDRGEYAGLMAWVHNVDRNERGLGSLAFDSILTGVAGDGTSYNMGGCGAASVWIGDRSQDMYNRNYFAHPILGCAGTQYVFSTYENGWSFHMAGENIAWEGGIADPLDSVFHINTMWLNSPEHYANMMGTSYSRIGCGTVTTSYGSYQGYTGPIAIWTCEFMG